MRQKWLKLGAAAIVFVLVLLGISYIAIPAFIRTPDAVRIVVSQVEVDSSVHRVIFDRQFTHPSTPIYTQLVSGVQYDSTRLPSCPDGRYPYYHYVITFFHLGLLVATATSDASGCAFLVVTYPEGSISYYSWGTPDNSTINFWIRLHQLTNAPVPINVDFGSINRQAMDVVRS